MGVYLTGIALNKSIEVPKEVVHFYKEGGTLIFLKQDDGDIRRLIKICNCHLLDKADFSEDYQILALMPILKDQTFVVFHYSEWADLINEDYSLLFINGQFKKSYENARTGLIEIGLSFQFIDNEYYWSYEEAKWLYLENAIRKG